MNHSARRINNLARLLDARTYLEIGVAQGLTFREVKTANRTGVDPGFKFATNTITNETTRLFEMTSDAFFATAAGSDMFDIVFIDGLHTFEQVVRDFSNTILHTHSRSAILIDDTLPDDVYSALRNQSAAIRFRKAAGSEGSSWHGDVFKTIFYIHDFWTNLNFRTIVGSGNPQTLVWRGKGPLRTPLLDDLEKISRLNYFDLQTFMTTLNPVSEEEAILSCVTEIDAP